MGYAYLVLCVLLERMGTPTQIMPLRMRTRSAGRPIAESRGGGTGEQVSRGGRGRGPRGGNDERVDEFNGQGNDQGLGANGGVEGVNGNKSFVIVMQKLETELWNHAMVGAGHAAYTNMFHELARLVPHLVTPESRKIERNGSIKKVEKRGNVGEPIKDKNGRDDNKRTKTGNAFASTANLVGRENMGAWPKGMPRNVIPINARNPTVRACYECGSTDHVRSACPRLNRAQGPEGNRPNQVAANNGGQCRGNQGNQARGRAFMLGAEEARHDPNIVTGIEPNELDLRYEIEIDSGQLVEIDKVIKGCKLEIEGHVFDIDLIHFGHGSFDVIIGMDWLSNHKAEIICHEKVVKIPLLDDKVLKVLGERPEEKARLLMSAKASDKKQEKIIVVREFLELTPGATPVAKSPYHLEPSELEELSRKLKELQDKGFIRPSSSP
ncbi:putative reverse transcriptase domain-containing protein [Tanacetum coccineum]